MKFAILTLALSTLAGLGTLLAAAQAPQAPAAPVPASHAYCWQEYHCGANGCAWIWICN